jgi:hypothetical protein
MNNSSCFALFFLFVSSSNFCMENARKEFRLIPLSATSIKEQYGIDVLESDLLIKGVLSDQGNSNYSGQEVYLPLSLLKNLKDKDSFTLQTAQETLYVRCVGADKFSFERRLAKILAVNKTK